MNNNQCPFKNLLEPKGPKGLPFIGSFFSITWNLLNLFSSTREKYGDVATFKLFGFTFVLVSHPNEIAQIFKQEKTGEYQKSFLYKHHYPVFGNGLFNSYGDDWERQKKQLQPFFKKNYVKKWFDLVVEESLSQNQLLIDNQISTVNIEGNVRQLVQNIMSIILFGTKNNEDSLATMRAIDHAGECLASHGIKEFIFNGLLNKIPTPGNLKYKQSIETIDRCINNMSKNKVDGSLLNSLSGMMSQKELRDQLTTFYFGGQDTTGNTVLWVLYYLAKHPEYQQKVRAEVSQYSFAGSNKVNYEDLESCSFLNATIKESMRLSPAAYATQRDMKKDMQLGNYRLKKDSLIILSTYVTHRHPDLWENPLEYNPERFLNENQKTLAFFPFGGGKRTCIGMHLAVLEITTIIALFVSTFEFKLDDDYKVKALPNLTLKPKNGLSLIIKKL